MSDKDVDQADLQGNILCAYGFPQAAHLFCHIDDPAAARRWLGELAPQVTSAEPWGNGKKIDEALNVALSFTGLQKLGIPQDQLDLDEFPDDFKDGMLARAELLRDSGEDLLNWDEGLDDQVAHILVSVHVNSDSENVLADAIARATPGPGLTVLHTQKTAVLAAGREHFGFSDGLAQPAIKGEAGPWNGQGTPAARGGSLSKWAPLAAGEFILGCEDEDGDSEPGPELLCHNATYMVVRKLEQHVDVWERQLRDWAGEDKDAREYLAAQLVGRWKNGTPVVRSPDKPDPELDRPAGADSDSRRKRFELLNDFRFSSDMDGARCPVGSHVRRANPRDGMGHPALTRRHRLIRRGMPYGAPPANPEVPAKPGEERGLLFVCFQASIARQFELVQSNWLSDGDPFGLGSDSDAMMSPGDGSKTYLRHGGARIVGPHARTVTLRGGGYFIVPSKSALKALTMG